MKNYKKSSFILKHSNTVKSALLGTTFALFAGSETNAQNNVSTNNQNNDGIEFSLNNAEVKTSKHIRSFEDELQLNEQKNNDDKINLLRFLANELREETSGGLDCQKNTTRFASRKGTDIVGECLLYDDEDNEMKVVDNKVTIKVKHQNTIYTIEGVDSDIASEISKGGNKGLSYNSFYKISYKAAKSKNFNVKANNSEQKTADFNKIIAEKQYKSL